VIYLFQYITKINLGLNVKFFHYYETPDPLHLNNIIPTEIF